MQTLITANTLTFSKPKCNCGLVSKDKTNKNQVKKHSRRSNKKHIKKRSKKQKQN